jgi:hypothetical protein
MKQPDRSLAVWDVVWINSIWSESTPDWVGAETMLNCRPEDRPCTENTRPENDRLLDPEVDLRVLDVVVTGGENNRRKMTQTETDLLILRSARMALEAYGDLRDTTTGAQMPVADKQDIITANERSWIQRVREAHNGKTC